MNSSSGWKDISGGKWHVWGQSITVTHITGVTLRLVIAPTQQKQNEGTSFSLHVEASCFAGPGKFTFVFTLGALPFMFFALTVTPLH